MGRKERRVFHKEEQKVVKRKFLWPKIVDDYNNGMNKVDQQTRYIVFIGLIIGHI